MKKPVMIILLSFYVSLVNNFTFADTCPPVYQFTPQLPPGGWSILIPAIFPGKNYHFVSATHSLNPTFYNFQIICSYECTSKNDLNCSPFSLVSNAQYRKPNITAAPWNAPFNIINTLVCQPVDNNPLECVFTN